MTCYFPNLITLNWRTPIRLNFRQEFAHKAEIRRQTAMEQV
jgi:hypothetical protein